jgi:nucleosome assembly protein 1-like 1
MEALENQDVDEEELEELDERLEVDYQIGEDFKEKIIPRAVDYFTGKALQYDDQYDEDFDEDDEDDYSDEVSSDLGSHGRIELTLTGR